MTTTQPAKTAQEPKPEHSAGIEVGAEELVLVIRKADKPSEPQNFTNTPAGRARLAKKLAKLPGTVVCMEATGVYHFDLAIALHDAGVSVMVVNPRASHNFAKVLMKNSKRDAVDADTLAEYAERMDFVAWVRPSGEKLALRGFSPRINVLNGQKAAAKNHLHALEASAVALMGELLLLPPGLTHREWVKFVGLDPRAFDSGKSVHKKTRVSKAGNRHIRAALYFPAMSAVQHDPYVKAYYRHLTEMGKLPLQGVCAVMRKLLHAIHGMLKHDKPFDNTRFYAIPASAGQ